MAAETQQFLDANGVTQTDLAPVLGIDSSSVSRKVSGLRPWKGTEIGQVLAYLSKRLRRVVTYEEVFGSPVLRPRRRRGARARVAPQGEPVGAKG